MPYFISTDARLCTFFLSIERMSMLFNLIAESLKFLWFAQPHPYSLMWGIKTCLNLFCWAHLLHGGPEDVCLLMIGLRPGRFIYMNQLVLLLSNFLLQKMFDTCAGFVLFRNEVCWTVQLATPCCLNFWKCATWNLWLFFDDWIFYDRVFFFLDRENITVVVIS